MLTFDAEKHEYKFDGKVIPSVTQIMEYSKLVDLEWVSKELLEEKGDLGTKVHKATELYDQNILDIDDLHPVLRNYLNGWIKFKKDYDFQIKEIEQIYYHPKYSFAGTLDRVGIAQSVKTLVDIKSGTKQKVHEIQTAAYKLLYDLGRPKKEMIKKRLIVYLSETGYKVEPNNGLYDDKIFLAALTIYNYKKGLI